MTMSSSTATESLTVCFLFLRGRWRKRKSSGRELLRREFMITVLNFCIVSGIVGVTRGGGGL